MQALTQRQEASDRSKGGRLVDGLTWSEGLWHKRLVGLRNWRHRVSSARWVGVVLFVFSLSVVLDSVPEAQSYSLGTDSRLENHKRGFVVGLDARGGLETASRLARGSDFDSLRAFLRTRGLQVRTVQSFGPNQLNGLDLLVLQQPVFPDQYFRVEEREAIQAFVENGGSLLAFGNLEGLGSPGAENLNQLLQPFGVAMGSTEVGGVLPTKVRRTRVVDAFVSHPVTRGLSAFRVDFPRSVVALREPARSLTINPGACGVLVAVDREQESPVASGRIIVVGDASVWADPQAGSGAGSGAGIDAPGNRILLGNLLDYFFHQSLPPSLPELGQSVQAMGLQIHLADLRDAWFGIPSQASSVLRLLIPGQVPGQASSGCFVEIDLSGARPGAFLLVLLGEPTKAGTLANPHLLQTLLADAQGQLSSSILVPASAAGHTFGLRLLDPVTGETSPVMRFQPQR